MGAQFIDVTAGSRKEERHVEIEAGRMSKKQSTLIRKKDRCTSYR
jgi:hypothetical protein